VPGATPSQTVGPFFSFALTPPGPGLAVDPGAPGAVRIAGAVEDGEGAAVPDAMLEIWGAGPDGGLADGGGLYARAGTDPEGRFEFVTLRPGRVDRTQAPHLDVSVFARGLLHRVVTRIYFPDEAEANAGDPVLAALAERAGLLVAQAGGDGVLRFDVRLQGDRETPFLAI
jgi:protocatechuate 3,4-dioxygenase alpha subunit